MASPIESADENSIARDFGSFFKYESLSRCFTMQFSNSWTFPCLKIVRDNIHTHPFSQV
jgi:hypothetical protein